MEHGPVAIRQLSDKGIGIGQPGGGIDFLVCGIQPAKAYILHHRVAEQMGILEHHAERPSEIRFLYLVDVDAVVADLAVLDIVEAVDQVRDRRLAGAGGTDKGNFLARLRIQLHIMEHDLVRFIAEINLVHDDISGQRHVGRRLVRLLVEMLPCPLICPPAALRDRSVFPDLCIDQRHISFIRLRLLIEKRKDAPRPGQRHDDRIELLADLVDGHIEASVECQK